MAANQPQAGSSYPTNPVFHAGWSKLVMVLFVLLMLVPAAWHLIFPKTLEEASEDEGRRLAEVPQWPHNWTEWLKFPKASEEYANDHLGLRQTLLTLHHRVKMLINTSPAKGVIPGKNDWLFFGDEFERDDIRGLAKLSLKEKQLWRSHLNRIHDRLHELGIPFIFVVAPDKSSIYPEYLPRNMQPSGKQRFEDLLKWLNQSNCRARVLDLRPLFLYYKQKNDQFLYLRDDTHWNDVGASIGVKAMIQALNEQGAALPLFSTKSSSFRIEQMSGDLTKMIRQNGRMELAPRLNDPAFKNYQRIQIASRLQWLADALTETLIRHQATVNPSGKGNILIIRDSFFESGLPYLSSVAHTCNYLSGFPSTSEIIRAAEDLRPDAVIFELVERNIGRVPYDPTLPDDPQPFEEMGEVLYDWKKLTLSGHIKTTVNINDVKFMPEKNGMSLVVDGPTAQVRVREVPLSRSGDKIVRIRLYSPTDTRFRLFTLKPGEKKADPASKVIKLAKKGWNTFYIEIPDAPMADELILDPGDVQGSYELVDLMVKTNG